VADLASGGELRRFLLESQPLRGHWVQLDGAWRALREHRAYPPPVAALLGEAAAAVVLLAAALKFEGTLTLQLTGNGRVRLLVAQCTDDFGLRAMAEHDVAQDETPGFAGLAGAGTLVVTMESRRAGAAYQGVVPLDGASLGACLEHYFERSEQLPTRLLLAADAHRVGGIMLQKLPGQGGTLEAAGGAVEHAWEDLQAGLAALGAHELLLLPVEEAVRRVAGEHDCRLFAATSVAFRCRCSRARVAEMVRSLGPSESRAAIAAEGAVTVTCEFCGRSYRFDAVDVDQLFAADGTVQPDQGALN
jgi:molecular chaperone Hsp33